MVRALRLLRPGGYPLCDTCLANHQELFVVVRAQAVGHVPAARHGRKRVPRGPVRSPLLVRCHLQRCSKIPSTPRLQASTYGRFGPHTSAHTRRPRPQRSRWWRGLWAPTSRCPRQDSNLRTRLRRPLLYPLSYGGVRRAAAWRRVEPYQLPKGVREQVFRVLERAARGGWGLVGRV